MAPGASGEEYGDDGGNDFAVERGAGLADKVPAEHTGEQPHTGNDGSVFGNRCEERFSGGVYGNIPDPEDYRAGGGDHRDDDDFIDPPAEARFLRHIFLP